MQSCKISHNSFILLFYAVRTYICSIYLLYMLYFNFINSAGILKCYLKELCKVLETTLSVYCKYS